MGADAKPLPLADVERLEEKALAVAQAAIAGAMRDAGLSQADLARNMSRPRSFITKMLRGEHNLTIRTLARALAACGFEIDLKRTRLHAQRIVSAADTSSRAARLLEEARPFLRHEEDCITSCSCADCIAEPCTCGLDALLAKLNGGE